MRRVAGVAQVLVTLLACCARVSTGIADEGLQDAELVDVCRVGSNLGWAVGDRGAIWHTDDGGLSWNLQPSGVSCQLNGVFFLDQHNGWAVGGFTSPYVHTTHGVIIHTIDGGQRWTRITSALVPTLEGIRFFDSQHGIAFGRTSAMFPSAVFTSNDGGRSWAALASNTTTSWTAGDFVSQDAGMVAGPVNSVGTIRRRSLVQNKVLAEMSGSDTEEAAQLAWLRDIHVNADGTGWIVGTGGRIFAFGQWGHSWQPMNSSLPPGEKGTFDFHTVATCGSHVWVAGSPGTHVFHSSDAGRSWDVLSTDSLVPINALRFADPLNGWAVGGLGTILTTNDGGRTWQKTLSGGERVAVLGVFRTPEDVPLELIARVASADGYLTRVALLGTTGTLASENELYEQAERAHEATVGAGGSGCETGWPLAMSPRELYLPTARITAELNRSLGPRAVDRLESYLVQQIRMWRPDAVVTRFGTHSPADELMKQVVLRAVAAAAQSDQTNPQAGDLTPWRVTKVLAVTPDDVYANIRLDTTQIVPRLGQSLHQHVLKIRGLLRSRPRPTQKAVALRELTIQGATPTAPSRRFGGLQLTVSNEARRQLSARSSTALASLKRASLMRRNMQAIMQQMDNDSAQLDQLGQLIRNLDAQTAADVLAELALEYETRGQLQLAAHTYELLCQQHPQHAVADYGYLWLVQYWASEEAAKRAGNIQRAAVQQVTATVPVPTDAGQSVQAGGAPQIILRENRLVSKMQGESAARRERCIALGDLVARTKPQLFSSPELRFALAAAHRQADQQSSAEQFFLAYMRSHGHDAWWSVAQRERLMSDTSSAQQQSVCVCRPTHEKPFLDGILDEPCWAKTSAIHFSRDATADDSLVTTIHWAYDKQYLYLAVRCEKAAEADYPRSQSPRGRDPDLTMRDRVEFLIDVDRDYATYYQLTIDHRGFAADACWEDPSWNPTWYVAQRENQLEWTVEAAVPLADMTNQAVEPGRAWAVGVQRIVPRVGFTSWTQPAYIAIMPQGFGLMMFGGGLQANSDK